MMNMVLQFSGTDSYSNKAMYEFFMETNFKRVPTLYPKKDERVILADLYAGGPKLKKE